MRVKVWPLTQKFALFTSLVIASHWGVSARADKARPPSVFKKFAFDLEIGGPALEKWISTVVDLDRVEQEEIPWRNNVKSDLKELALKGLNIEDEKVLQQLPPEFKNHLLEGLTDQAVQSKILRTHLGEKKIEILGIDGKPIQKGLILPDEKKIVAEHSGIYLPGIEVKKTENQLGSEAQKAILSSEKRRAIIHERWNELIKEPAQIEYWFKKIPLKSYSPKIQTYLVVSGSSLGQVSKIVKPNLPFLDRILPGMDVRTLELRVDRTIDNQAEYESRIRKLSDYLGLHKAIYDPQASGAEKAGAFHSHLEFRDDILTTEELYELMTRYKAKNAIEVGLYKQNVFGDTDLNQYFVKMTGRGNVRLVSGNHYELRELPHSPEVMLDEFNHYLEGLDQIPPSERLKIAIQRMDQKLVEVVQSRPAEFKALYHEIPSKLIQSHGTLKEQAKTLSQALLTVIQGDSNLDPQFRTNLFKDLVNTGHLKSEIRETSIDIIKGNVKANDELITLSHQIVNKEIHEIHNHLIRSNFEELNLIPDLNFYQRFYHEVATDSQRLHYGDPLKAFQPFVEKSLYFGKANTLHFNFTAVEGLSQKFLHWHQNGFAQASEAAAHTLANEVARAFDANLNPYQSKIFVTELLEIEDKLGIHLSELDQIVPKMHELLNRGHNDYQDLYKTFQKRKENLNRKSASCDPPAVLSFFKNVFK